jgi:hypothetical protein
MFTALQLVENGTKPLILQTTDWTLLRYAKVNNE